MAPKKEGNARLDAVLVTFEKRFQQRQKREIKTQKHHQTKESKTLHQFEGISKTINEIRNISE